VSTTALPRALVLDLAHPRAVAVVQSLARLGVEVIGIDHRPFATGFVSRGLARKYLLTDAEGAGPQLDSLLEHLAQDGRGGILLPTSDEYLTHVVANHQTLERWYTVPMPRAEVFDVMLDREASYRVAREVGLATPQSFAPANETALDALLPSLDFERCDYVIKTGVDDVMADLVTLRHTKVGGPDGRTLRERWLEIAARARNPPTIERIVPGEPEHCLGVSVVMSRTHAPVAAFCTRRLRLYRYARGGRYRHPYEMGANVYCESVYDEEALDGAIRLLQRIGFYGAGTVEFRRDPGTGVLTLIKIDPRVVRATSLSASLGMDVPALLYRTFALQQSIERRAYPDRIRWMWVNQYLYAVTQNATWRSVPRDALALLRTLPRLRAVAFLSAADPLPFVKSLAKMTPMPRGPALWIQRRLAGSPRPWPPT